MRRAISIILLFSMLFATGCWDRMELNDLGIELGWGLDAAPNQQVETIAQVVIPSKMKTEGGGGGKPYYVVSGIGKTTLDATQHMQAELSRKVLRSHRRVIFIGDPLAKRGLKDVLDTYARDPQIRMRTDVFVTENHTSKEFLQIPYPLESIPAVGALKEHTAMGGLASLVLLDFYLNASTPGSSPTLPIIKEVSDDSGGDGTKSFAYGGRAIFNQDLKMVGSVPPYDAQLMFWVKNANKYVDVAVYIPQGNGEVTVDVTKPKAKIQPIIKGNQLKFRVILMGNGAIRSANTKFDLRNRKYLKIVESDLEQEISKQVQQVISTVQKEYGADVFGFGEAIHRKYPYKWKKMKNTWDKEFQKADVSVETRIKVERVGLTGPPLQLKESEIER